MVTETKNKSLLLSNSLKSLGCESSSVSKNVLSVRLANAQWVRDGLNGLGIDVSVVQGPSNLDTTLQIPVPEDEEAFEKLTQTLKIILAPEALLFDIDDTLADVTESYRRATVATAKSFGATVTYDDITKAKAAGNANNDWELTCRMVKERGIDASLAEVTEQFEELYQGTQKKPGFRESETLLVSVALLERLADRITLGVVTGRPLKDALTFLEAKGIKNLFKALATMDDGSPKPSPGPCLLALERLGVKRAWMVGDTPDDVRSALAAGVLPLGVIAPADDPEVARSALMGAGAARVLKRLEDIEELLP